MEDVKSITKIQVKEEEVAQANLDIWKYVFGFTPMAIVKCAIQLGIADVIESHGGSITLSDLSTTLDCTQSSLLRIMRYLIHHGFFKLSRLVSSSLDHYIQTPLSRLLIQNEPNSMAAFLLLESSPVMLSPWHMLSAQTKTNGPSAFEASHGMDVWTYAAKNPTHSKLIDDAMANHARGIVAAIIDQYSEVFNGVGSLIDVGGGDGTSLCTLVKACPWIRGINFDLPHVVSVAPICDGVEHVGGDMFQSVPNADAAFIMWVLHDWSDEECIEILRNCLKAIPKDKGKVIIAEAVIEEGEGGKGDKYCDVRLALDMVMLAHTEKGKERTLKEWEYVVKAAGFGRCTVKHIEAITAVIEAYP